jgi:hypothetical protein
MDKFDTSQVQGYLVGQVIAALVGILMLLLDDFGGFYYRDYYNRIDFYGYIYLGSGVLATILILLGVGGLLVALQSTLRVLKAKEPLVEQVRHEIQRGIRGAGFTVALAAIGAVALLVGNLENEWWFEWVTLKTSGGSTLDFTGPFLAAC